MLPDPAQQANSGKRGCDMELAPTLAGRLLYAEGQPLNVLLLQQWALRFPALSLHVEETGQAGVAGFDRLRSDAVILDMHLASSHRLRAGQGLAQQRCANARRAMSYVRLRSRLSVIQRRHDASANVRNRGHQATGSIACCA